MSLNGFEMTDTHDAATTSAKYFTVDEANAALPLVSRIVRDIVEQYRQVMALHARSQEDDLPDLERDRLESARAQATDKLDNLTNELTDIGCDLKDWESGLVDFPARLERRDVYLCWKLGEEHITQWHEVYAGFAGREPIATAGNFEC